MIADVDTEEQFSEIYLNRKTIIKYFDIDIKSFNRSMNILESIQYQESWPREDYIELKATFQKVKSNLKVKDGI